MSEELDQLKENHDTALATNSVIRKQLDIARRKCDDLEVNVIRILRTAFSSDLGRSFSQVE